MGLRGGIDEGVDETVTILTSDIPEILSALKNMVGSTKPPMKSISSVKSIDLLVIFSRGIF